MTPTSTAGIIVFDFDGNGDAEPLNDGLLALRYLFGFRGTTLTSGALGIGCMKCDPAEIEEALDALGLVLDVDDNGLVGPLTDGRPMLRFLFGFTGDALIDNAVAGNCGRCTADEIEDYLQPLA